jgi:hypothetical protein
MWPILVKKPDGPWSNCYGVLGLGPPHHRQRHLCLPSSTLGLYCPKLVFFQCCPQIMHKICLGSLPKHWFFVSFGIWGRAKWVLGLPGGGGLGSLYQPTQRTYLHRSPIHLPKPLFYLLRLSTFSASNSLPPPFTPKVKIIKKLKKN